ncbi:MAG: alpha/beta hydrolase [Bacteroidetes bacterium]|nr:alpha/beta hydrolase [Bacteroidota bacterium]
MKKLLYLLVLLSASVLGQENDFRGRSEIVLQQFVKNEFLNIYKQIDTASISKIDTASIAKSWKNLIQQNGKYVKNLKVEKSQQGNFEVYAYTLQFEKNEITFRLIWGTNKKIKGYYFTPVDKRPKYQVPSYHNAAAAKEKKVLLTTGEFRIPGSLVIPNTPGKHPVVILVHGSGANDRDETFGPLKPFRDLTSGLTAQGIAVLRFEKRTRIFKSKMSHYSPNYTVKQEVLEDVQRAIEVAKADTSIDTTQIYICGHSFGGMMLPRIAKENPSIKGLIYLTPNARRLEDLFVAQAEYIANEITDPARKKAVVDSIKVLRDKVKSLSSNAAVDSSRIFDSPVSLWYELRNYDPIETAKTLDMPMLFIFGGRDYQVTSIDSDKWFSSFKSNEKAAFKMYPNLNHFLIAGEGKSLPAEYEKPGNVDEGLINDISTWIKGVK